MAEARPSRRTYRRTVAEQSALEVEVLRVALTLFAQGGSDAISMRKLAAEVGVAPMSLYRYFPSKAHLMRHIWQDVLSRANAQGLRACAEVQAPLHALHAFLGGFIQYWLDNPDHYPVVFASQAAGAAPPVDAGSTGSTGSLRPDPQSVLDALADLLDDCAGQRRLPPAWRQQMAAELFCGAIGFLLGALGLFFASAEQLESLRLRMLQGLLLRVEHELAGLSVSAPDPARPRLG